MGTAQINFSCELNKKGRLMGKPHVILTKQNLGKGSFAKRVKSVCSKLGIRGYGAREILTTHGTRSTVVVLLIESGYDNSTIMFRTGHRSLPSLRNYHDLRGSIGLQQISKMLGEIGATSNSRV